MIYAYLVTMVIFYILLKKIKVMLDNDNTWGDVLLRFLLSIIWPITTIALLTEWFIRFIDKFEPPKWL